MPPAGELWASFAMTDLDQLHETWQRHFDALDAGTLGAASHTRAIGPDLEVVVLTDVGTTDPATFDEPTLLTDTLVFTVRLSGDARQVPPAATTCQLPVGPQSSVRHRDRLIPVRAVAVRFSLPRYESPSTFAASISTASACCCGRTWAYRCSVNATLL